MAWYCPPSKRGRECDGMFRACFVIIAGCLVALLVVSFGVVSAPLKDVPVYVRQPDGEILDLLAAGDEFYNWVYDREGFTVIRNPDTGYAEYAALCLLDIALAV